MPNEKLKLWSDSIKEYCEKSGKKYQVPRKGSHDYCEVKKIYAKKCSKCKCPK